VFSLSGLQHMHRERHKMRQRAGILIAGHAVAISWLQTEGSSARWQGCSAPSQQRIRPAIEIEYKICRSNHTDLR
jgi:hypothetical protein